MAAPAISVTEMRDGNIMKASNQWRYRPDDQRYLTLEDLHHAVAERREASAEVTMDLSKLQVKVDEQEDTVFLNGRLGRALFTNYAFGQMATLAGAPAGYLRKLPAPIAAINLQYGLERNTEDGKLLVIPTSAEHDGRVMAATSPTYGRIWDQQVVEAVQRVNTDGRWKVPAASYATNDPKRATTLYASDHDVFLFMVDDAHPVEVGGDTLFRGFITWNSEVGDRTFGLMSFLYRFVCDNRIIWDASEVRQLTIRHNGRAPEHFAEMAVPALKAYAEGSTARLEQQIRDAKTQRVGTDAKSVTDWLIKKGFGREVARVSVSLAEREEGDPTSLWNAVQGVTAYARSISHTDTRLDLERSAGALLAGVMDD